MLLLKKNSCEQMGNVTAKKNVSQCELGVANSGSNRPIVLSSKQMIFGMCGTTSEEEQWSTTEYP